MMPILVSIKLCSAQITDSVHIQIHRLPGKLLKATRFFNCKPVSVGVSGTLVFQITSLTLRYLIVGDNVEVFIRPIQSTNIPYYPVDFKVDLVLISDCNIIIIT